MRANTPREILRGIPRPAFCQFEPAAGDLIAAVVEWSENIQTGSTEIPRAAQDLASRSESSAASLEQTSAGLPQIDERLRGSAASADETLNCAKRANASVTGGRDVASGAVGSVDGALVQIADMFGQVDTLVSSLVEDNRVQAMSISEIVIAVSGMDTTIQQNAAMVEETSAAAQFDIEGTPQRRSYAAAA